MKHFFNVLMWVALMSIPVVILLIADGLQAVVRKGYWPYKAWVEKRFPTR